MERSMKILIANIGSTSFKYRLFDIKEGVVMAQGRIERIGQAGSACPDYEAALGDCLEGIVGPGKALANLAELAGIGFKAVHARPLGGARLAGESGLPA